ncbi:MAG: SMC family ATPase [bacterium]|nr:SMC family ATPase [bacterium]
MIRLRKLELQNFRIHEHLELEFAEGTNVIIGENGVGKTTIFLAIIFALFGGQELTVHERERKQENLIKRGASSAKIKLELEKGDAKIVITRTIERGAPSTATIKIYKNNTCRAESGASNVTQAVLRDIFEVHDAAKLAQIIYIRQGELGEFIESLGKLEGTKKLNEILGLKKYEEMKKSIEKIHKEILEITRSVKDQLERTKEMLTELLGSTKLEELEEKIKTRKKLEELKKKAEEYLHLENALKQLKITNVDEATLLEKINSIKNKISELEKIAERLAEKEKQIIVPIYNRRVEELVELFSEEQLQRKEQELLKELNALKSSSLQKKEILQAKKVQLEQILLTAKKIELKKLEEKEKVEQQLHEIETRIHVLANRQQELEQLIQLLSKRQLTHCPVCGSDISDKYEQILQAKRQELEQCKQELEKLRKKRAELQRMYSQLESIEKEVHRLIRNIEGLLNKQFDSFSAAIKAAEQELQEINKILAALDELEAVQAALKYKEREKISAERRKIENELRSCENELMAAKSELETINRVKNLSQNLKKLEQELAAAGIAIDRLEQEIVRLEKEIAELPSYTDSDLAKIRKFFAEVEQLSRQLEQLDAARKTLEQLVFLTEKFCTIMRVRVLQVLDAHFRHWFRQLYIYNDIRDVALELDQSRRAQEPVYTVRVLLADTQGYVPLQEAGLSGGQRIVLDLALRFALISLFSRSIGFIMLDEPTHSLDENVREKFAEVLKNLQDMQVLVCTHDEVFRDSVSGKGYVFKREGEKVKVEELSV